MKKKTHRLLLLIVLLTTAVMAQSSGSQTGANPDRFGSLILDQTSPDEAIKALGNPESDKLDRLNASKLDKWLDAKHKEKIFRKLTFKKVGAFYSVELSFLDNKLVLIELEFKKNVSPKNLKDLFGVEFAHIGGPSTLPDKPGQYPAPFFATGFPLAYNMVGISDKTFILASCTTSISDDPGRVERTRQISRVLEKK
jgi:hypothetical protein